MLVPSLALPIEGLFSIKPKSFILSPSGFLNKGS